MICRACENGLHASRVYDTRKRKQSYKDFHHATKEDFLDAVAAGCTLCRDLYASMSGDQVEKISTHNPTRYIIFGSNYGADNDEGPLPDRYWDWELQVVLNWPPQGIVSKKFVFEFQDQMLSKDFLRVTEDRMSLPSTWLAHCVNNHEQCIIKNPDNWVPTRLIDVDTDAGTAYCKLVITKDLHSRSSEVCQYISLSHRWGSLDIPQLVSTNQNDYLRGIQISTLPTTFVDAIWVARKMNIKYIWIDSLCIVQDSSSDWSRESSMMQKVYSHSYFRISATESIDGTSGFFLNTPHTPLPKITLEIPEESTAIVHDSRSWARFMKDAPLHQRGWVLQEHLLSPRTLHFTRNGITWECIGLCASEQYPSTIPVFMEEEALPLLELNPECVRTLCSNTTAELKELFVIGAWLKIVMSYSRCEIKYDSDKLIAISGIGRAFKSLCSSGYLAGIWNSESLVARSLAWYVPDGKQANGKPSRVPAEYRAPSFSWAAVDGIVKWDWDRDKRSIKRCKSCMEIKTVSLTPSTDDPFGAQSGGWIRVRAPLRELKLGQHRSGHRWELISRAFRTATDTQKTLECEVFPDSGINYSEKKLYFALLYLGCDVRVPNDHFATSYALLLESLGDTSFKRVGLIMIPTRWKVESMLNHLEPGEQYYPSETFDEEEILHTFLLR